MEDGMGRITVIGIGPGGRDCLLPRATERIEDAELLAGSPRLIAEYGDSGKRTIEISSGWKQAAADLDLERKNTRIAVLVSGDPMLYSFTALLLRRIPRGEVEIIPGISSFQYLAAETGMQVSDAVLVSLHGRRNERYVQVERLTGLVRLTRLVPRIVVFCDGEFSPARIAGIVGEAAGENATGAPGLWTACIGCNLGLDSERILRLPLDEAAHLTTDKDDLCVMILQREHQSSTA
ncbi:MAG: precorrin-6y C5,15-methyltransferase (decarboxylating) subunit CbiE [Spirochaetia bacterium]